MNPIEHVWDALGRRVAHRQPPPQTLQELKRALLEELGRKRDEASHYNCGPGPRGSWTMPQDAPNYY
ncbi:hypothetical protein TNCV_815471 [Trichonephila clavipes]|nr:hypothetical protein TNCV_815471 [Trichonephila clavipes]